MVNATIFIFFFFFLKIKSNKKQQNKNLVPVLSGENKSAVSVFKQEESRAVGSQYTIIREENKERLSDQTFLRGVWLLTFLVVTFQSLKDENDNLSFEALRLTFAIFPCLTTVKAIVCLLLQKKSKKKNMDWLADRNTSQYISKLLSITVE